MSRTYYHATDCVFEKFDPARQGSKGASNGHLGVWVATDRSGCEMFGDVLLTLSMPEESAFPMSISELFAMHQEARQMDSDEAAAFYRNFASTLLNDGYNVIEIYERQGNCHCILLDIDRISVDSYEVLEKERPSVWGMP